MEQSATPSERTTRYAREVRAEAKKVVWPDRRQTVAFTIVVVAMVVIVAGMIWIADSIFQFGMHFLV